MHPFLTCEDVLEKILEVLVKLCGEDRYDDWPDLDNVADTARSRDVAIWPPKQTMMTFMLVSRPFLEVGRRALYREPSLHAWGTTDEIFPLFQGTVLHLNPHLGTYVRKFWASELRVGPVLLSRMIASMPQLQHLSVASLTFVDHYPSRVAKPRLALLEVSPERDGWGSAFTETQMDRAKLGWMLSSYEVRLRALSIFARDAMTPALEETNMRILRIEQCRWDATAFLDILPQIGASIRELIFVQFGKLHMESVGWVDIGGANDDGWGTNAGAAGEAATQAEPSATWGGGWSNRRRIVPDTAAITDVMRSAVYAIARHIQTLSLDYSSEVADLACLDLSLLPGTIKRCEVTLSKLMESKNPYVFPRNTLNLIIKTVQLDGGLLQFIESLQKPDYLLKLESCPEIWIREDLSRPGSLAPAFPTVDSDRWVQARATAAVSLTDRGLQPLETPSKIQVTSKGGAEWTRGHAEYLNFWAVQWAL